MQLSKDIQDSTKISDLIESPNAVKALASRGITTIADLRVRTIEEVAAIPGIGNSTLDRIRELQVTEKSDPTAKSKALEVEESNAALVVISQHQEFALQVLNGDAERFGTRGLRQIPPIYISCKGGRGKLTREEWFARKYNRNREKMIAAVTANEPWRKEAFVWLQSRKSYGRDFHVLTD